MASYIIVAIVAYLLGSISFSVIISKKMAGFDVREKGSGNAGATNMLRSVGKGAAALTLLADALKGVVAILFAIIVEYENLCNEYYNIVVAKITTSSVIEDTPEAEVLKDHIRSMIKGKDVHFTFHVDESIIGGVIVEMEDIVYDYSIRNLLTELGLSISDNG